MVRPYNGGREEILREPAGLRAGAGGQARPEETSRRGKFPATTDEEEEGDAAVLVRLVRPVYEQRGRTESSDDNGEENISECFRTLEGAEDHITLSSVAITSRKQGLNVLEVIAGTAESFLAVLRFE